MKIGYKKLYEGEVIPFGFGYSYRCWTEYSAMYYLIPFNFIIRWLRNIYFGLWRERRETWIASAVEFAQEEAYKHGYNMGIRKGEERAYGRMFPGYDKSIVEKVLSKKELL